MVRPVDHDAYAESAAPFAQPILAKIRDLVHRVCPEVEESIKWSAPHFEHHGNLVAVAAFKRHVNLSFWRGSELPDPEGLLTVVGKTRMAMLRIETLDDLPSDRILARYLKAAMQLNEAAGGKAVAKKSTKKARTGRPSSRSRSVGRSLEVAPDLLEALGKVPSALSFFEEASYSFRKEYSDWVQEAKREATREKRIATAVEWISERKPRNWKYMKKYRKD